MAGAVHFNFVIALGVLKLDKTSTRSTPQRRAMKITIIFLAATLATALSRVWGIEKGTTPELQVGTARVSRHGTATPDSTENDCYHLASETWENKEGRVVSGDGICCRRFS